MKIQVCGCGGIGSFFAEHINKLIDINQIDKEHSFTFFDDDIVEKKNILYQNFKSSSIDEKKAEALSMRFYNLNFKIDRVNENNIKNYDLIILCADNNEIRKITYNHYINTGTRFIDSRATGRAVGLFSSNTPNYLKTLSDGDKPTSCQNPYQIEKKEIEYGNVIIASILAQATLNFIRNNKLPNDFQAFI